MTPIEAVHTFARRDCIGHLTELKQEQDSAKAEGRDKDVTYHPRRFVVEAILMEVERVTPADFRSRGQAALRLIETGQAAQNHSTEQKMWQKPPYLSAMQEERDRFCDALRRFASEANWKQWRVEPLPYRRTLREEESRRLMAQLREQWGITKRWWVPFDRYELTYELLVLDSTALRDALPTDTLQGILSKHGIERLYELWESEREPDREIEWSLWEPYHSFTSGKYWLTDSMDWLFYTTHENTTTVAGDWLLREIKAAWSNWEAHRWVAPWKQN